MSPISRRELIQTVAGFTLLTVALTYPQIRLLSSHMAWHYDTLFSVWRLGWIAHQLPRDPFHLFDANIFHPERHTLAYSDALLLPGVLGAPLIWLGVDPVSVHNLLLLFSFVACGVSMYVLVRELTGSSPAAWVSGIVFAFQPYRFDHYAQLETLWGWPIPLAFLALHRLFAHRRLRDGMWLGVFVALQIWSCLYYAVFLITMLMPMTAVLLWRRPRREVLQVVRAGLVAAAVALVLAGPYLMPYVARIQTGGVRTEQDMRYWSPTLINYLGTVRENWLYGRLLTRFGHFEAVMFPGLTAVAAAVLGLLRPLDRRRLAYGVLLILAFDLSLGANGFLYTTLYRTVWVYRGLRVPERMFIIFSVALAVLAGDGVARLLSWLTRPLYRRLATLALVAAVLVESVTVPVELYPVATVPHAYVWLADQPPGVVMEWPMPKASSLGVTHEPLYMYYSTRHWQKLVNGYSGFYPPSYIALVEHLERTPLPDALAYLRTLSVHYIILHSEFDPVGYVDLRTALGRRSDVEILATERQGSGEIALYRLLP